MIGPALVLAVLNAFNYELFFVISLIGLLVVTELTAPINVRPVWRTRLTWPILAGLLTFAYSVVRFILKILPRRCSRDWSTGGVERMRPVDWLWAGDHPDWPRVLLVALVVATSVAIGVVASTQPAACGPNHPEWDGTSHLRGLVDEDSSADATITMSTDERVIAGESVDED